MNDFETLPLGTIAELKMLREFADRMITLVHDQNCDRVLLVKYTTNMVEWYNVALEQELGGN